MMRGRIFPVLPLLVFFFAMPACGMGDKPVEGEKKEKSSAASDFKLKDLGGNEVSLSQFRGKVVFLNFWATWCPPCRTEMPSIEKLHRKYGGKDFVVLAVAIDTKGAEIVRPYIDEKGFTFVVLVDAKAETADSYDVFGVPMTFVIGRDGKILNRVQGGADWFSEESQQYFEELIGGGKS